MNKFKRQLALLASIMIFLSAITIFLVSLEISPQNSQDNEISNNTSNVSDYSINITEDDVFSQSLRGIFALNRDIRENLASFMKNFESGENLFN